ncbi:Exosome complex component rrp42 [Microsporum ferrugineum]
MAPPPSSSTLQVSNFSPAELSYLHTSLSYPRNPIRPDGRSATQFRPLAAETNIVPNAYGSARIGFADGTQAIVGVKAEVEKTVFVSTLEQNATQEHEAEEEDEESNRTKIKVSGSGSWVEMSIEIPGLRDDDPLPVFLAEMMREGLIQSGSGSGGLKERLVINQGWHWRVYVDVLLLSPPLSYPLPLLSLTTHLALLSAKLPRLISKDEEDPMFDDDWDAAEYLYPRKTSKNSPAQHIFRPPISLLVISVGQNIIFDPSREEIAVADSVFCVSVARDESKQTSEPCGLKLLAIRNIDPPARMTHPGVPDAINAATMGLTSIDSSNMTTGDGEGAGVWTPRRGGLKRDVVSRIVKTVLQPGGVGDEVMEGLETVEVD